MDLLYLTSYFPKRSETFVYREVLGLRKLGVSIITASLHESQRLEDEPVLQALADETIMLYPAGIGRLLLDAASFSLCNPISAFRALSLGLEDFFTASDLRLGDRVKIPVQTLAALALAWRLRHHQLSGIHIHMAHAPTTVGMYLARALAIPMSFTGHAVDLFRDRSLLRQKLQRATFVSCISSWHRNWYRSIVPGDDSKYPVIRCGVEVPERVISPPSEGPLRILGLARLVSKKGFDTLMEALSKVNQQHVSFECTLAGDGPEFSSLQEMVRSLGLSEQVRFLGGVAHGRVSDLLRSTDVMILPCKVDAQGDRDGIPVALMEAMAHGLPVICGDLPTIRELIEDRVTGLLVPPGNSDALAEAICELASDSTLRTTLGIAGRDRVNEEFASGSNLARLMNSFSEHRLL